MTKKQHITFFEYPEKIEKIDFERVKWDTEYLTSSTTYNVLKTKASEIINKDYYTTFDKRGLTKEKSLEMCKEYDKNVKNGYNHPLTQDQIKTNEEAKEKNKIKQAAIKVFKEIPNDINKND